MTIDEFFPEYKDASEIPRLSNNSGNSHFYDIYGNQSLNRRLSGRDERIPRRNPHSAKSRSEWRIRKNEPYKRPVQGNENYLEYLDE